MSLQKAHSGNKKMAFGEHRDLEKVMSGQIKIKRVNVNFDEEKHTRLKYACLKNNKSITEVINKLVDDWLKTNG